MFLLKVFVQQRMTSKAKQVFDSFSQNAQIPSGFSFNIYSVPLNNFIGLLAKDKNNADALDVYEKMKALKIYVTTRTYAVLINIAIFSKDYELGKRLYKDTVATNSNATINESTTRSALHLFIMSGDLKKAEQLYASSVEKGFQFSNARYYEVLIGACISAGEKAHNLALRLETDLKRVVLNWMQGQRQPFSDGKLLATDSKIHIRRIRI
jgi:hypothetical protein